VDNFKKNTGPSTSTLKVEGAAYEFKKGVSIFNNMS
jgi:hypothetical protein